MLLLCKLLPCLLSSTCVAGCNPWCKPCDLRPSHTLPLVMVAPAHIFTQPSQSGRCHHQASRGCRHHRCMELKDGHRRSNRVVCWHMPVVYSCPQASNLLSTGQTEANKGSTERYLKTAPCTWQASSGIRATAAHLHNHMTGLALVVLMLLAQYSTHHMAFISGTSCSSQSLITGE